MKALLLSGNPRTFVFQEQINFFRHFINENKCDVYILLKIAPDEIIISKEGLHNLRTMLEVLKPVFVATFHTFSINNDVYYSQIKMIDFLLNIAMKTRNYDYFIRMRPDMIVYDKIYMPPENIIYTSYKIDAIGNDQFFIMSKKMAYTWWIKQIRPTLTESSLWKELPDYVIFNTIKKNTVQKFNSGLVRTNRIDEWNPQKINKHYFIYPNQFTSMDYSSFLKELSTIMIVIDVIHSL
jgi:hypothetical protein